MGTVETIGRALLSLALVLGVMWALGRWAKGRNRGRSKNRDVLTVMARQQLSRNASVAIVKVVDRALIVGITDGQISLLGDADLEAVEAFSAPTESGSARTKIKVDAAVADAADRPAVAVSKARTSALQGSALSPGTWTQALDALRERTTRR